MPFDRKQSSCQAKKVTQATLPKPLNCLLRFVRTKAVSDTSCDNITDAWLPYSLFRSFSVARHHLVLAKTAPAFLSQRSASGEASWLRWSILVVDLEVGSAMVPWDSAGRVASIVILPAPLLRTVLDIATKGRRFSKYVSRP